ncbi:unnamed protein product [Mytilus edulis]|uniref:Uncharacterized protein n=1 Tax=Mytilus edulis TaxID=6550 RepID=A0A8S3UFE2_MYTED|nr:unnamed protein product [Mytilus edulis]
MAGIDVYTFHEEEAIPKPEDRAFLTYIADKTEGIIDEEHIITKPEELRSHSDILLNKDIQKSCQRYFTEDAWLCVLNTLKQLQELSKDEEGIINTTKEDGKINTTKEDGKDLPKNIQLNPAEKDAEEDDKYEETKKAMGYNYWSMKLVGNDMYVSLDGHELDMYLKVKGIEKTFGKVYDVELFTALLIKVNFKEDFIIVGLHDFSAASNEFSKSLPSTAKKEEFLASLKQKSYSQTQGYSINQADQEDRSPLQADQEDRSPLQADQEDRRPLQADQEDRRPLQPDQMVGLSEAGNDTQDVQGKSGVNDQEKNSFIEVANKKVIGTFKMPIEQLDFSSDSHSIRKIEPSHCREIITKMKISFLNGDVVSLPDAIGMVPSLVTSEDIKSGKEKVEIIDGNHTLFALRELHEEFPSEKCFESRKVIIYQDLSRSEVFTMALLGNEKAGTVQYTKPIDKLMIMRKVLDENFNGKFSSDFQDHVYKIFNAVCPDNPKEQERRRKKLAVNNKTINNGFFSPIKSGNN